MTIKLLPRGQRSGPIYQAIADQIGSEIGAGRLDQHVEPQSNDEFGALVDAFNTMAGELATSRRKIDRSTIALERKHVEGTIVGQVRKKQLIGSDALGNGA